MREKLLKCDFYIGDQKVDKVPQELIDKMCDRLSKRMSEYYTQHPDEFLKLKSTPGCTNSAGKEN